MIEQIRDLKHFEDVKNNQKAYFLLIFYTDTSQKSIEALKNLEEFKTKHPDVPVYAVNASKTKDIHKLYNVNAVPTVLLFKKGELVDQVYGVQSIEFYERFVSQVPVKSTANKEGETKKFHRVIIYTSTTCPWCAAAKAYLSKNHIPYTEINVSKNPSAADELVRRTGHTGVPQIDIDGTFVIGFDKPKINKLLGIN